MKSTQKNHDMYMANARNLLLGPNATYIPLTCVRVSCKVTQILGLSSGFFAFFRYQHEQKFALQWNIGLAIPKRGGGGGGAKVSTI